MKSIIEFLGVSSCCIAFVAAAARAEPTPLADVQLDRIAAGACMAGPGAQYCNDTPGFVFVFPLPFLPNVPGNPQPHEPPGCETGACNPGPGLLPTLSPIAPVAFPPLGPLQPILWPSPGGYCGPACDPGPAPGPAGG